MEGIAGFDIYGGELDVLSNAFYQEGMVACLQIWGQNENYPTPFTLSGGFVTWWNWEHTTTVKHTAQEDLRMTTLSDEYVAMVVNSLKTARFEGSDSCIASLIPDYGLVV